MLSSQIISSLFDFVREVFNSNNRKKKTKWYIKLGIGVIILSIGILFIAVSTLTAELYEITKENKRLEEKAKKLDVLMEEYKAIKEVNTALISIIRINIPNSGAVLPQELVKEIKSSAETVTAEVIKPVERAKVLEEIEKEVRKETGKPSIELDKEAQKNAIEPSLAKRINNSAETPTNVPDRLELPKQSRRQRALEVQNNKS